MMQTAEAYEAFAYLYSRTMAEDFCRRAFSAYLYLLSKPLSRGSHLLDVCCGSGQWARELTRRGFCVTGLDASREMLRLALRNAPRARFVLSDARKFWFAGSFSGVISAFNSLAHANSPDDLLLIFRNVRSVLADGCCFVFDISMEEAYANRWRGKLSFTEGDVHFTLQPSYDRSNRIARNDIVVTKRCRTRYPQVLTILQRCHSEDEIRAALRMAGFHTVQSFDAEEEFGISRERGRRFFRCV